MRVAGVTLVGTEFNQVKIDDHIGERKINKAVEDERYARRAFRVSTKSENQNFRKLNITDSEFGAPIRPKFSSWPGDVAAVTTVVDLLHGSSGFA